MVGFDKTQFLQQGFHVTERGQHLIITTPQVFASGDPARFFVRRDFDNFIFDDYGSTHNAMTLSLPNPGKATEVMSSMLDKLDSRIEFEHFTLIRPTKSNQIGVAFREFLDLYAMLTTYQPKSSHHQESMAILENIYRFLKERYNDVIPKVKYKGLSGLNHKFNFQADNTLVDFAHPNGQSTGALLRKIQDVKLVYNDFKFNIILDDSNQRKFDSESRILSSVANIRPYSLMLAS